MPNIEASNKFCSVYRDLYNSADTSAEMEEIKERVEAKTTESSHEVTKIIGSVVKLAAVLMKKNKANVTGSYSSDAMRNAPDIFYDHLAAVFRSWLNHGAVTRTLLACAFLPLLKSTLKGGVARF